MGRILAIADVHGCLKTLEALINKINLTKEDTLIFCGDYVDRGPDSKGVIEYLITLQEEFNCRFIEGNHDEMFNTVLNGWRSVFGNGKDGEVLGTFSCMLNNGGHSTFKSYGIDIDDTSIKPKVSLIPPSHREFLDNLEVCVELETEQGVILFTHASLQVDLLCHKIELLPDNFLKWSRSEYGTLRDRTLVKEEYYRIVYGHTPNEYEPLFTEDYAIGVDGGACFKSGHSDSYGRMFCVDIISNAWTSQRSLD